MIKFSLCSLLLGLLIVHQSHAQLSYTVAVAINQTDLCEQVLGVDDAPALLEIHPNPSADFVQVSAAEAGHLQVVDVKGHSILSVSVPAGTSGVDLRRLKQGLYILRLNAGNRQWHARFIKQ